MVDGLSVSNRSAQFVLLYWYLIMESLNAQKAVFRIRIRIHMLLGLPDPDLLIRGMNPNPAPDPSIIKQK
jgi:hypothetical protein